jgi:GT2 family glycosyltransferase
MEISVIVVTMGSSRVLPRCVAAIASGRLRPREVVLVDQGPGDELRDVEAALAGSGIGLVHVPIERSGVSKARNLGAAAAAGDHLAFTDDDCVPDRDWLAALAAGMERGPVLAATGRVLPLDEGRPGLVAVSLRTDRRERTFAGGGRYAPWEIGTGGNLLVERRTFDAIGGFNLEFGPGARFRAAEDIELLERVIAHGASIHYAPAAIVYHELKRPADRLGRGVPYGFGMGALIARLPRGARGRTTGRYVRMQTHDIANALLRLRPNRAVEAVLMLAGAVAGRVAGRSRRNGRIDGHD